MSIITVTNEKTADMVKPGDAYIIDVWPPATQEDQFITQEMLDLADKLEARILKRLSTEDTKIYTKAELNGMKEAEVVEIAIGLGLSASVSDRKSDTIAAILKTQG